MLRFSIDARIRRAAYITTSWPSGASLPDAVQPVVPQRDRPGRIAGLERHLHTRTQRHLDRCHQLVYGAAAALLVVHPLLLLTESTSSLAQTA